MSSIEKILLDSGPSLSTDLVNKLVDIHNLSPSTARKRVSRGFKGMNRLDGLPFPRNAKFIYLQKDYRSPFYWKALFQAFKGTNSVYWFAIAALLERGGIIPYDHFLISCGSPRRQQKHVPPDKIIERLESHGILSQLVIDGVGKCILLTREEERINEMISDLRARLVTERILLKAIAGWIKNLGLVSYHLLKDRDSKELPTISTTVWDLAGPSYLSPLIQVGNNGAIKQGFWACDILLGKEISEDGLQPFIKKCIALRSLKNVGKCMQMFVADKYQLEAFNLAKTSGIIPATPESLFGLEVAEGLKNLLKTLQNVAGIIKIEPEKINTIFDQLGRIEGASGNLRGAFFEYLAARIIEKAYNTEKIILNRICKTLDGLIAESDIIVELKGGEILFIECKGHQPLGIVEHYEVERWIHKRVPTLRKYALEHTEWKSKPLCFALWTTGKFSDQSLGLLKTTSESTNKYQLEYLDGLQVRELISSSKDKDIFKTYQKHFYEHPLSKLDRG